MLTQKRLKELLHYDPDTGVFTWHERPLTMFPEGKYQQRSCRIWNNRYANKKAGCIAQHGYVFIRIEGKLHTGHQLAWLYSHGHIPKELDHANRDRADNRLTNLRESTSSQNKYNRKLKINKSGRTGVYWHKANSNWYAQITIDKRTISLGSFALFDDATKARNDAETKYHGEFACQN